MKLLISLLLVIILYIVYRKSRVSYAEGFTLYFTICSFCFQGSYFYLSPLKFLNVGLLMLTFLYWKKQQGKNEKLPIDLKRLFYIYFVFQTLILIFSYLNDGIGLNTQFFNFIKSSYLRFGLAFLAFFAIKQIDDIERFNKYLKAMTFFVCVYGIIEYFTHINIYSDIISQAFPDIQDTTNSFYENQRGILNGRIGGTLIHPLNLGQMLIVFLGYFVIIRKSIGLKGFYKLATLILITIILTGSRSCILPALLLYGTCALIDLKSRMNIFKILLISGILCLLIGSNISLSDEAQSTIDSFLFFWDEDKAKDTLGGSSVDLREQQWEMALYIIGKNTILFGRGFGFMSTDDYTQFQDTMRGAESILFTFAMEQGILGLIAFIIVVISIGVIMRKYNKMLYGKNDILILIFIIAYLMSLIFTGDRSTSFVFFTLAFTYIKSIIIINNEKKFLIRTL